MPISYGTGNTGTPDSIRIRPDPDGSGWEMALTMIWGNLAGGTFTEGARESRTFAFSALPGLTSTERTQLATLLGKIITATAAAKGLTNPTRAGRYWSE